VLREVPSARQRWVEGGDFRRGFAPRSLPTSPLPQNLAAGGPGGGAPGRVPATALGASLRPRVPTVGPQARSKKPGRGERSEHGSARGRGCGAGRAAGPGQPRPAGTASPSFLVCSRDRLIAGLLKIRRLVKFLDSKSACSSVSRRGLSRSLKKLRAGNLKFKHFPPDV